MKKHFVKICALCLILLVTFSTSTIAATDPYEPNNSPDEATFINNPAFPNGQGVWAYISPNDIDFYKFYTPTGGLQRVHFIPPDNQAYWISIVEEEDLKDGHAQAVASALVQNAQLQDIELTFYPKPGTYYIAYVIGWQGAYNVDTPYYFGITCHRRNIIDPGAPKRK